MLADDTIQDLKEFNSQSSSTQAKKTITASFNDACYQKAFDLMGDDIVDLSTENDV